MRVDKVYYIDHMEIFLLSLIAKKNLSEMRQLYLKLRERVFSAGRLGMGYNTESFEKVLKEAFGTEALMSDVTHPKLAHISTCQENVYIHP